MPPTDGRRGGRGPDAPDAPDPADASGAEAGGGVAASGVDAHAHARARLIPGDCLAAMAALPGGTADLVYLDPPFNTGRTQRGRAGTFDDAWPDVAAWLAFLAPRLDAALGLLRPHGAIMVHCDWRTSHHVRLALEERLGPAAFVNHLVWHYGLGGSSPRRFARKHDDILYFATGPDYWFEAPRVPARSRRMAGMSKKATDVLDVPAINNQAHERTGWPTQKPLALLELLVTAACPPGGLVVDPFCGSGTTVLAAIRTGRRGVGIDRRPEALAIARRRLDSDEARPGGRAASVRAADAGADVQPTAQVTVEPPRWPDAVPASRDADEADEAAPGLPGLSPRPPRSGPPPAAGSR